MAKIKQQVRRGRRQEVQEEIRPHSADIVPFERQHKLRGGNLHAPANANTKFEALTKAQGQYYLTVKSKQVTFAIGPAGTGKSHVAIARACEMLNAKEIDQIIVTRPIQGVGEEMGFLPGDVYEKTEPYFAPIKQILQALLGYGRVEMLEKAERIRFVPLQFIRGLTFDNAFMLLDEAQNCSKDQMKAFLTRIGHNTTVAVDGDLDQSDVTGRNGLADAVKRFKDNPEFGYAEFDEDDIVRSDVVKTILIGYRKRVS